MATAIDRLLGSGLVWPLRSASQGGFVTGSGEDLARSNVMARLTLQKGTVPWNANLGSRVHTLRHKNLGVHYEAAANSVVTEAIEGNPRYRVTDVELDVEPAEYAAWVHVRFDVVSNQNVLLSGVELDVPI